MQTIFSTFIAALSLFPVQGNAGGIEGKQLVVAVSATTEAHEKFWKEKCINIPLNAMFIAMKMGNTWDYFRPTAGNSFCDMLTTHNKHEWSNDGHEWHTIDHFHTELGGSGQFWPQKHALDDNRRFLSFWGSTRPGLKGGCCSYEIHKPDTKTDCVNNIWGHAFHMYYIPPTKTVTGTTGTVTSTTTTTTPSTTTTTTTTPATTTTATTTTATTTTTTTATTTTTTTATTTTTTTTTATTATTTTTTTTTATTTTATTTAAAKNTGGGTETNINATTDNKSNVAADAGDADGPHDDSVGITSPPPSESVVQDAPNTGLIVGIAIGTVCLLGVVVALIFLRLKTTANKDEVALRARMANNMQHALYEQVHVNHMFDGANNADADGNAGGGAPTPSGVYAEAVTHNEDYMYAPFPPPTERQGAPANAGEPEYAMPQNDYAPLKGGNTTYCSSA